MICGWFFLGDELESGVNEIHYQGEVNAEADFK
jgi:hypothetical protein